MCCRISGREVVLRGAHERHALATDPCAEDSLVFQGEEVFIIIIDVVVVFFVVVVLVRGWHCPLNTVICCDVRRKKNEEEERGVKVISGSYEWREISR